MLPAIRRFRRFACLDWSGQAVARPAGIALAECPAGNDAPILARPPGGWSRGGVRDWLRAQADRGSDLLIGIDFSPALPFADRGGYFPGWDASPADAPGLWALVERLCAAEPHLSASTLVAHADAGRHFRHRAGGQTLRGDRFEGSIGRLRMVERACRAAGLGNAVSCFNLIGAAQVGKSSLTGMRLLHHLRGQVPIWPFDPVPVHGPLIVEIYTTVAARAAGLRGVRSKIRDAATLDAALHALDSRPHHPLPGYDDHATDALLGSAWLRRAAAHPALWRPPLLDPALAATEGWTFGVP